jgi:maltokinase
MTAATHAASSQSGHTVGDASFGGRLAELLAEWLPRQRWFGGKGRAVKSVAVTSCLPLSGFREGADPDGPRLWHVLAEVVMESRHDGQDDDEDEAADEPEGDVAGSAVGDGHEVGGRIDDHADGTDDQPQTYQLFVGLRSELPDRLRHAEIGDRCYDALHDPDLTGWLLERLAGEEGGEDGDAASGESARHLEPAPEQLRFGRHAPLSTQPDGRELRSLVLTGEQSNTSLVFGDRYIAKVFRRPAPGLSPELELGLALTGMGPGDGPAGWGTPHVAPPLAWAEYVHPGMGPDEEPVTLLTLQPYLRSATDGWVLALTSVRDLFAADPELSAARTGADFAPEARRLGRATARVHRALAAALPSGWLTTGQTATLAADMRSQLAATVRRVPELRPHAPGLAAAIDRLAQLRGPLPVQRVHGDFHLGQAMRTTGGWVLLDFEGEPARSLEQRRAQASPLKDISGMLRSFDYAAHHLLADLPPLTEAATDKELGERELAAARAAEWAARNRDAFCRGYAEVTGYDPRAEAGALRAFEIDKAVYEVGYEAANRPSWLQIPLAACARLAGE